MRNIKTHTITYKKKLSKCKTIFKAYNPIQFAYGNELDCRSDVVEIKCNVPIVSTELDGSFTTDFYCIKLNGDVFVRECVYKEKLLKPFYIRTLDVSRNYWLSQGVKDWGIVLNEN